MTGRDLIIYILENNLEDQEIFKDGKIIGLLTINEAAVKFGVGSYTIKTYISMNWLPSVKIGEAVYVPANAELKKEDK